MLRVVLDTNTIFRGLANRDSAAGRLMRACEGRRLIVLLSRDVIVEYRRVLEDAAASTKHSEITPKTIELALRRLRYVGEYLGRVNPRFRFFRDPDDAKFIELAIAGSADCIVTHDRDLLSLPTSHTDDAKRFRQRLLNIRVLTAVDLVDELEREP